MEKGSGYGVLASGSFQSRAGSWAPLLRGCLLQSSCLDFGSQVFPINAHHGSPPYLTPPSRLPLLFSDYAHLRVRPCGPFTTVGLVGLPPRPLRKTDYKTPLSIIFNMQNTVYYLELPLESRHGVAYSKPSVSSINTKQHPL